MRTFGSNSIYISLVLALGACATNHSDMGSVSLPIKSVGDDGATYRLPVDTRLSLTNDLAIANYDVSLDADVDTVTFTAEPGSYHAEIYNLATDYGTMWPLTRTAMDGTTSIVTATLVTPQPSAMNVLDGQTTSLTLQFAIATGGTVTFGKGTVSVTVDVGDQPATSFTTSAQGSGDVTGTPTITGPYAAQLTGVMPAAGTTGLTIAVSAQLTGNWQQAGGAIEVDGSNLSVCAPITVTATMGGGNPGFAALLAEAGHGNGGGFLFGPASICITDFGTSQEVRIRMSRTGAAETSTLATVFGTESVLFWNVLRGTLPTPVYDPANGKLDLSALAGTRDLPMRLVTRIGSDISNLWYVETIVGQMTFSFVGHP